MLLMFGPENRDEEYFYNANEFNEYKNKFKATTFGARLHIHIEV